MSEPTIEEAYAILAERCWWRSRTDDGDQDHVGAEKKAARALALATLEEATDPDLKDHEGKRGYKGTWCCSYHMLRARIEALGR